MISVRRFGWWPDASIIAIAWFVLWAASALGRGWDWLGSWDQSLQAVSSCSVIVWPIALGVTCARSVFLVRTGTISYLRNIPGRQVFRYLVRSTAVTWAGAALAGMGTAAVAATIALIGGSWPSAGALPSLGLSILGLAAASLMGSWLGLLIPVYAMAVAVTVLGYAIPMMLVSDLAAIYDFTGSTASTGTALRLASESAVTFAVLFGLAIIVALCANFGTEEFRRAHVAGGVVTVLAAVIGVVGMWASLGHVQSLAAANEQWETAGSSGWSCEELSSGSTVCLARDVHAVADEFRATMTHLDAFNRQVFGTGSTFLYAAAPESVDGVLGGRVFFPVGVTLTDPRAGWEADAASWYLIDGSRLITGDMPDVDTRFDEVPDVCIAMYPGIRSTVHDVLNGESVDVEDFRESLRATARCDG